MKAKNLIQTIMVLSLIGMIVTGVNNLPRVPAVWHTNEAIIHLGIFTFFGMVSIISAYTYKRI